MPYTDAYPADPYITPPFHWESQSQPVLEAIRAVIRQKDYLSQLTFLWGQESGRSTNSSGLRSENVSFVTSLGTSVYGHLVVILAEPYAFSENVSGHRT